MRRHQVRHGLLFDRDRDSRFSRFGIRQALPPNPRSRNITRASAATRNKNKNKRHQISKWATFSKGGEGGGSGSIEVRRARQLLFLHLAPIISLQATDTHVGSRTRQRRGHNLTLGRVSWDEIGLPKPSTNVIADRAQQQSGKHVSGFGIFPP